MRKFKTQQEIKFSLTLKQSFFLLWFFFFLCLFFCLIKHFIIAFLGFQSGFILLILHLSALRSGWRLGSTLFHSKNSAFHEFKTWLYLEARGSSSVHLIHCLDYYCRICPCKLNFSACIRKEEYNLKNASPNNCRLKSLTVWIIHAGSTALGRGMQEDGLRKDVSSSFISLFLCVWDRYCHWFWGEGDSTLFSQ